MLVKYGTVDAIISALSPSYAPNTPRLDQKQASGKDSQNVQKQSVMREDNSSSKIEMFDVGAFLIELPAYPMEGEGENWIDWSSLP